MVSRLLSIFLLLASAVAVSGQLRIPVPISPVGDVKPPNLERPPPFGLTPTPDRPPVAPPVQDPLPIDPVGPILPAPLPPGPCVSCSATFNVLGNDAVRYALATLIYEVYSHARSIWPDGPTSLFRFQTARRAPIQLGGPFVVMFEPDTLFILSRHSNLRLLAATLLSRSRVLLIL